MPGSGIASTIVTAPTEEHGAVGRGCPISFPDLPAPARTLPGSVPTGPTPIGHPHAGYPTSMGIPYVETYGAIPAHSVTQIVRLTP